MQRKSYFVRESGAYFPPSQPAVCFPRWEPDARQETSRVVRMGLLSRRDYYCATICHYCATIVLLSTIVLLLCYYCATCGTGSVFRNDRVDDSDALHSTVSVVNTICGTRVSDTSYFCRLFLHICFAKKFPFFPSF